MGDAAGLAPVMVTKISPGVYRVEHDGRTDVIYVAGTAANRWIFWNGQVFHRRDPGSAGTATTAIRVRKSSPDRDHRIPLFAPMPARVGKILLGAGAAVKKGDTVIVLEAMKMELPVRAPADGTVAAVRCREGELVAADAVLAELT